MKEEILKELLKSLKEDDKEASLIIFRYPHSEQEYKEDFAVNDSTFLVIEQGVVLTFSIRFMR